VRLVLDTNVWLDWLVFGDPCVAPIRAAIEAGAAEIFIDEACEAELARVLAYPRKRETLDAVAQAGCLAECRRLARKCTASPPAGPPLPRCRDPDDQKFLELARTCEAQLLVTRDKALLALARHSGRGLPFRLATPARFAAALEEIAKFDAIRG
jgi:putative PIN family toxin of toxin-antitoxin system